MAPDSANMRRLRGDIENQTHGFSDLTQDNGADVAVHVVDSSGGDRSDVLALRSRWVSQAIIDIGLNCYLRCVIAKSGGERHNLDHAGFRIENRLGSNHHSWMTKADLASLGKPEIEPDNITRGQHPAIPIHRA